MEFDWDDANETHIARHGVTVSEVQAIVGDPFGEILDSESFGGELRYRQVGSTPKGRILVVIFAVRDGAVRPVTAYDASPYIARQYREGLIQ